jgi:hypothetical protein
LAAEQTKPGAEARRLVRENEAAVRKAEATLRPLAASERVATLEESAVSEATKNITALENRIAELEAAQTLDLHPPGGFDRAAQFEGRRPGIIPSLRSKSGQRYHERTLELQQAHSDLANWEEALTRTLKEQVEAATPGAGARDLATLNAETLEKPLRPIGKAPIDVTTGAPMTTSDWATDHLMSRAEISRDPRFARLSPIQRDAILLDIPENYLPMTAEANGSKGALSVKEWIAARERNGQPLPKEIIEPLLAADARARDAIEAFFKANLPK